MEIALLCRGSAPQIRSYVFTAQVYIECVCAYIENMYMLIYLNIFEYECVETLIEKSITH